MVCHSFADLIAAEYASGLGQPGRPPLAALVLLNAAPPSGNSGTVTRTLWRSPIVALKITW